MEKIKSAITIRAVENKFLELFNKSQLNGTVHTCVGQEFSATSFCYDLDEKDYVFSNHRCHGHYIAFTKEYKKLIAELMGKDSGVCAGIGGSQHLCTGNFFSNGPQGSLAPVAVGTALANKKKNNKSVVLCFIGDGTMGEGIIYESMNLASLMKVPILFVCENNKYAQSTPINDNLAGDIISRAESFNLDIYKGNTWDYQELSENASLAINNARNCKPGFFLVDTYRLNAHSKGDDDRNPSEIKKYVDKDPINLLIGTNPELKSFNDKLNDDINSYILSIEDKNELTHINYIDKIERSRISWSEHKIDSKNKQVDNIYNFFKDEIDIDKNVLMIGEDIKSPYGGAFKITKNLSDLYPDNIISTPISEAGIVGMGIGLALNGFKPYVEIMFGDFISYAFDQILSNASKFYSMYNKQVNIPLNIRTPMGGGRGYGPTHSQSLEKHFNGINNIEIIALNSIVNIQNIYKETTKTSKTNIIIENKLDYGRLKNNFPDIVKLKYLTSDSKYPITLCTPKEETPDVSMITYGGGLHPSLEAIDKLFIEFELFSQIVLLTKIYPLQLDLIADSVKDSKYIITIEEGSVEGGYGSEIISSLIEKNIFNDNKFIRVGSENIPIPSTKSLEKKCLISSDKIIKKLGKYL